MKLLEEMSSRIPSKAFAGKVITSLALLTLGGCCAAIPKADSLLSSSPAIIVTQPVSGDNDGDGLKDAEEENLAQRFAPIFYYDANEPNLPTNVETFLKKTELRVFDDACMPDTDDLVQSQPSPLQLTSQIKTTPCDPSILISSSGTRSMCKHRSFYLKDVNPPDREGDLDSTQWVTYFHAFPNDRNGVTIQYWRFHAFNDQPALGIFFGRHGGDWEGVQVVLDHSLNPIRVIIPSHSDIEETDWASVKREGDHPVIYAEKGGHTSNLKSHLRGGRTGIRHETWTKPVVGKVTWYEGRNGQGVNHAPGTDTKAGPLRNLGEKTMPLEEFIRYSGLWGSPGHFYISTGYWGPAYNETGIKGDGFIDAWCRGMRDPTKERNGVKECYAETIP